MALIIPNTFEARSGAIQLSEIDDNFNAVAESVNNVSADVVDLSLTTATSITNVQTSISNLTLSSISGTVPVSKGGTGLTVSGDSGGVLISNGSIWTTAVITGAVSYFARSTAPTGWLKANGAAISRTVYSTLFASIGTTYGAGDGSTTFNIPDLRSEFLRGWDDGRGIDNGRGFGTVQSQDWKGFNIDNTRRNSFDYTHGPQYMGKSTSGYVGNLFTGYWSAPAAAIGVEWDGSEIRPRNVALLVCIKF